MSLDSPNDGDGEKLEPLLLSLDVISDSLSVLLMEVSLFCFLNIPAITPIMLLIFLRPVSVVMCLMLTASKKVRCIVTVLIKLYIFYVHNLTHLLASCKQSGVR